MVQEGENSMNLLSEAKKGNLYQKDYTYLAEVFYNRVASSELAILFLTRAPKRPLPKEAILVPEEEGAHSTVYNCYLSSEISEYFVKSMESTYYMVEASLGQGPEQRDELRVNTSFPIEASFDGREGPLKLSVIDISAGGLMFESAEEFETGESFSFTFAPSREQIPLSARIVKAQPSKNSKVKKYSCQFFRLSPKAETAVRQFVFSSELAQQRRKRDLSDL